MAHTVLTLCECCALMLANNDDSGCRDYHGHDHAPLEVPRDTVISGGPHTWEGCSDLPCHGHDAGVVHPWQTYWVAEIMNEPAPLESSGITSP